jgi:hypothetical protein
MSCFRWYSPYYPKETLTATYNRLFIILKDIASRHNLNFSPRRVSLDFDCASRNAATDTFPSAELLRFLFHYAKTIWRKTQYGGLQTAYKDVPDVTKLVRRAACLPLLPRHKVEDFWLSHWKSKTKRWLHQTNWLCSWDLDRRTFFSTNLEPLPNWRTKNQ